MRKSAEAVFDRYRARYAFTAALEPGIRQAVEMLEASFTSGGKLLICGNGGSAADADHIVGELVKAFRIRRPLDAALKKALAGPDGASPLAEKLEGSLPAINLCAHTALITAQSNDVGGDFIYAQQVIGYGRKEDVFWGISTSGNSKNVLYAGQTAKAMGIRTIGLTGRDGGQMRDLFDLTIIAPSQITEDIQDIHSTVYHMICAALECQFWGE